MRRPGPTSPLVNRSVRTGPGWWWRGRWPRANDGSTPQEGMMSTSAPDCRVVRSGEAYEGKQGLSYARGLTGETAGSRRLCMTVLAIPDGGRAKTRLHRGIETAVYIIDGRFEMFYGDHLEQHIDFEKGRLCLHPTGRRPSCHEPLRCGSDRVGRSLRVGRPGGNRAAPRARFGRMTESWQHILLISGA